MLSILSRCWISQWLRITPRTKMVMYKNQTGKKNMPKPLPSAMWIQVTSQRRFHPSFWDWSISISLPFPTLDFSSFKRTTTTKTHVGFSTGFCGFLLVWYQISFSQQKIARNRRLTLSSQKKIVNQGDEAPHMIVALTFLPLIGTKDPVSILSFRKPRVHGGFFFKELLVGSFGAVFRKRLTCWSALRILSIASS